ncbi:MAG: ChaN family lipoprotein, partial [Candidatus Aminicenantes bacterium]|nr:ChaN family lipoprotein [Candidatus Aminicenantes bacterium]
YALNAPMEIITKIRMRGWDGLTEEEKKIVPNPDLSHEEHRTLIRTIFEGTELPPQMKGRGLEMAFEGLYRAQSAWDEVMALNAVSAQKIEDKKVIVLAGSGHLIYNLGINRRAYERSHMPYKTVICVTVPEGRERVSVSRSLADYIWAIPEERIPVFPSVGLGIKKFEGLDNLVVESDPISGVALGADFKKGDIILDVDGKSFSDINELRVYLADFKWNDEVRFRLLRNANEVEVLLRFKPPEHKQKEN